MQKSKWNLECQCLVRLDEFYALQIVLQKPVLPDFFFSTSNRTPEGDPNQARVQAPAQPKLHKNLHTTCDNRNSILFD